MLTLLSELKFLTTRDDINVRDTDFGVFKYAEKKSLRIHQPYADGKQDYTHMRNQEYILHGRKSKRIKNSIKKLEEMLKHNRIIYCAWSDNVMIQILLSNGLLVHICIDVFTGDIIRMAFDKFLVGKLISETVCDVLISRMHLLISYDVNQLTFVYLQKPNLKKNVLTKIRRLDPKICNIIISGPTRKISRQLSCNNSYDLLAVWTKSSQNEVYPWRPTIRDQDRANIHIYRLCRNKLDFLCYYWTENDPINVEFSKVNQNQLRSVEQKIYRKGEVAIEICVYKVNGSKIQRTSITSIPLQSQVCCHSFSPDNEKLMLGSIDGSVILFDEGRGITHLIKAAFIPTMVSWHSDSAIVMIANEKSQIQYFDISLSCIRSQLINEDATSVIVLELTNFFKSQSSLFKICCSKKPDLTQYNEKCIQNDSYALLLFENGPIGILRLFAGNGHKGDVHTSGFTADVLIQQYLNLNNVEKAINLLLCLNWDVYGAMLMISLHRIANYIFKQPFQSKNEPQLQKALGSFLIPVKPLCSETQKEFGDQVRDLARKFFLQLLRYKSYEKAFTLAIDIDDEDLFMDLTNCARDYGYIDLANDAYQKAHDILTRSNSTQSSHSLCSHESCSVFNTNSSSDDSEMERLYFEIDSKITCESKNSSDLQPKNRLKHCLLDSGSAPDDVGNIPKRGLKISHYSKSTKPVNSHSTKENNLFTNSLKYKSNLEKTFVNILDPLYQSSITYSVQTKSQAQFPILSPRFSHHHIVDMVPKPNIGQFMLEYRNDPDQTIGIPIENSMQLHGPQIHSRQTPTSSTVSQITHYPLISGQIPPLTNSINESVSNKKNAVLTPKISSRQKLMVSSPILNGARQQTSYIKGEKNKVTFSNTVTVAVVPDITQKEQSPSDKLKQNNSNERDHSFHPKQELQGSLHVYNPNEDYLRDFMPIHFIQHNSSERETSHAEDGVLTWV